MARFKRHVRRGARIEMIPLIDIVFLLLVVFIYAMLSMTLHRGIRIELPHSDTAQIEKGEHLLVSVAADGSIYLDLDRVNMADLASRVAQETGRRDDFHVQVNVHESIPHGHLVKVLDRIREGGVTSLSILTQEKL